MDSTGNFRELQAIANQSGRQLDADGKKMAALQKQANGDAQQLNQISEAAGLPIFTEGEIVAIKGRQFRVQKINRNRLILKGLPLR